MERQEEAFKELKKRFTEECYSMVYCGTNSRVRVRDRDRQWSDIGLDIVISIQ